MKKQPRRIPEQRERSLPRKRTFPGGDPSLHSGIRRRGIFAYPTESFYALGADATDSQAIHALFRVKHREAGKPIALIAADLRQVKKFFVMTKAEEKLATKYWPGALTILLKPKTPSSPRPSSGRRGQSVAAEALVGLTTPHPSFPAFAGIRRGQKVRLRRSLKIGVRVPAHAQARVLALRLGVPITATSANLTGQPPTKSLHKVKRDFPDILVWPGRCGRSKQPSTVIAVKNNTIKILRPGSVYAPALHP